MFKLIKMSNKEKIRRGNSKSFRHEINLFSPQKIIERSSNFSPNLVRKDINNNSHMYPQDDDKFILNENPNEENINSINKKARIISIIIILSRFFQI